MDNRIHSALKSKISTKLGTWALRRHIGGLHSDEEAFPIDVPVVVTESVLVLEQRRVFALAATAIREEEKARLARELHDELAQSLTALKMNTIWVRDNVAREPETAAARLTEMVEMLDRTVAATRRMAADLRPLLLDDLGLLPAIEWLASSFTQRCGVCCRLLVDDELKLELQEPYATAVFRIVQESLNNVAKHAGATQVVVSLGQTVNAVKLVVQDDGCGFFTAAARKPQSLGLMGLRERAQLLGGSVAVKSAPGQGTCIEVSIPLYETGAAG